MRTGLEELRCDVERAISKGEGGLVACRRFSKGIEALVRRALDEAAGPGATGLALLAAGGLARSELAPRADLDLHFVVAPSLEDAPRLVERVLYVLWDAGLVLGHSVRSPDEVQLRASEDEQAATALLEARFLGGDAALAEATLTRFWQETLPRLREELLARKKAELKERRARFGGSVHLVEPNVKSSPGGLRDVHSLTWIGLLVDGTSEGGGAPSFTERESVVLREQVDTLLAIRAALHLVSGRAEDRLLFEHQAPIAALLGVESARDETPSEALMRRYFRAALKVRHTVDEALERIAPDAPLAPPSTGRARLGGGFSREGGALVLDAPHLFEREPARMIDAVRLAEEEKLRIAPETRAALYDALEPRRDALVDDPACGRALLELSRSTDVTGAPFTELLEMGVLGAVLRDIGRLEGRFKQDGYHAYTTDAHICRCTDMALRVVSGAEPPPPSLTPVVERTSRGHLVVLGALMHDIGKGLPGNHSETGVAIAAREAARMSLPPGEVDILRFLVAEHLALSKASQRRDLSDPAVVEEVARAVRTPERLDLLALLTWVDIASVAPGMFTDWKARLLGLAVERVRAYLLEPEEGAFLRGEHEAEVREQAREVLVGLAPGDVVERFVSGASVRTLASRLEGELVEDLHAFARWTSARGVVVTSSLAEGGHAHTLRVVCKDRRGLLADLASALSTHGANVLHANIDAREDGVVVDAFRLDDGRGRAMDPDALAHAMAALEEAGQASSPSEPPRPRRAGRRTGPKVASGVRVIEGSDTWGAVIVEVRGEDRPGLVAELARVFSKLGWNIVLAKINTEGRVARDTFYVSPDPHAGETSDPKALTEALTRCLES